MRRELIALAVAATLAGAAALAQDRNEARFVGIYDGAIFSTGADREGATTLRLAPGGGLVGDYAFREANGETISGELSACAARRNRVTCRWGDLYGVGDLQMDFAADASTFRGRWRADDVRRIWNRWTGRRRVTS
ncbi:MAG: hypothetical protein JNK46_13115 [Methylobacteriaceae bacterium]|nr:hypothetical protein [Methylobacteriaceae bacterium]